MYHQLEVYEGQQYDDQKTNSSVIVLKCWSLKAIRFINWYQGPGGFKELQEAGRKNISLTSSQKVFTAPSIDQKPKDTSIEFRSIETRSKKVLLQSVPRKAPFDNLFDIAVH